MSKFRIDIWRPKLKIPKPLRAAARAVKPYKPFYGPAYTLRKQVTVEAMSLLGQDVLMSDGYCGWHDDTHIDHQYSLLLVLRNDTGSNVRSFMQPQVLDQPPGTAILLDIWHRHKLCHPLGMKAPMGVWLALCKDFDALPSRQECEEFLKAKMNKLEKQDAA